MFDSFRVLEFDAKYIFITPTPRPPRCYPKTFPKKDIFSVPLYHSNAKKLLPEFKLLPPDIIALKKNQTTSQIELTFQRKPTRFSAIDETLFELFLADVKTDCLLRTQIRLERGCLEMTVFGSNLLT